MTDGTTMVRLAEWMTGPDGSSWTTSALPHISMITARRIGSAVNGSKVEFSSSTRRRPQKDPSARRGGVPTDAVQRDVCAGADRGADDPVTAT